MGETVPRFVTLVSDGEAMAAPFRRVVPTTDLPEEGLRSGDIGVVVEHYPGRGDVPEGYELEFFSGTGETVARDLMVVRVDTLGL